MNKEEKNNNNMSKSISKYSEYSDAFENYEDIVRFSNANNIIEKKNSYKEPNSFDEELSKVKDISIIKNRNSNSFYFPEDTNKNNDKNSNKKKKIFYIDNGSIIDSVHDENDSYLKNNSSRLNIHEIERMKLNNEKNNNLEESLYSNRDISDINQNKYSDKKVSSNGKSSKINVLKLKNTPSKNINFDLNLEPLDTIDNFSQKSFKENKRKQSKTLKKSFRKLLSAKNRNNHNETERFSCIIFKKKASIDKVEIKPPKFSKSIKGKRSYYDPNNILRKAVIMNSKKRNIDIIDSKNINNSKNSLSFSVNNVQQPQINNIKFYNIKTDELDTNFLKKYLRTIGVTSKRNDSKKNFFKTLIELQNFYIDDSSVWVIKLNVNGKYLAGGCKSGKIKIYKIIDYNYSGFKNSYNKNNIMEYLNFISETPFKVLDRHKSDIIDLSWSPIFPNLLLSASMDHYVCLWDVSFDENKCLIKEYDHGDIVTSVSFNPIFGEIFITGCFEHFVHVWKFERYEGIEVDNDNNAGIILLSFEGDNINKSGKKKLKENKDTYNSFIDKTVAHLETQNNNNDDEIDYFNIPHKITTVAFFPDGLKIAVGTEKGKIFVYNVHPKIKYSHNFFVARKMFGIFHGGKKVTNIQFINKEYAIVTTADSYIRYVNMNKGTIEKQYKGYKNEYLMTRAYTDLTDDAIIIGGEDGNCYVWKIKEPILNEKNKVYEYFKPFSKEEVECSIIANDKCYINYMQKILKLTNKILILNIIINGTSNGRLEILLNIKES